MYLYIDFLLEKKIRELEKAYSWNSSTIFWSSVAACNNVYQIYTQTKTKTKISKQHIWIQFYNLIHRHSFLALPLIRFNITLRVAGQGCWVCLLLLCVWGGEGYYFYYQHHHRCCSFCLLYVVLYQTEAGQTDRAHHRCLFQRSWLLMSATDHADVIEFLANQFLPFPFCLSPAVSVLALRPINVLINTNSG